MKIKVTQRGFSLVELIVYIAILSIVVSAVSMTAISMVDTFGRLRASQDIADTGLIALEHITREIRFANDVNTGASTFNASPGVLTLASVDASDNPITVTFELINGRVVRTEGIASTPLSRSAVTVSNLVFRHAVGTQSEGVWIECTVQKNYKGSLLSKDFRTFVVLKG